MEEEKRSGIIAFAIIYFTFFLDNVLLTVLVPIIPDWIRGESLALWRDVKTPLASILNETVVAAADGEGHGIGSSQAIVGAVLATKAVVQLLVAPLAAARVCRLGASTVLREATALLIVAALVFAVGSHIGGASAAWLVSLGRGAQGGGAALGAVAGLALAARSMPAGRVGLLLGAVAVGVLVGYPFGGVANALRSREAPFLIIAAALILDLFLQYLYLDKEEYNQPCSSTTRPYFTYGPPPSKACAFAVLLSTSVMASLEPCLPLWIMDKFHPPRWQTGAVFIPDSVGYVLGASLGGRGTPEAVSLAGLTALAVAAVVLPLAPAVSWLVLPHLAIGSGLGALDAALLPALLARTPRRAPRAAADITQHSSAAYVLGPIVGGVVSWICGFETMMRTLGVINLIYVGVMYREFKQHPLSEEWGAIPVEEDEESSEGAELTPLEPRRYIELR